MEEHDQYEEEGLNDSLEDERDLDQIMKDRRAAELELDTRDARFSNNRKLPQLLHDQGIFLYLYAWGVSFFRLISSFFRLLPCCRGCFFFCISRG